MFENSEENKTEINKRINNIFGLDFKYSPDVADKKAGLYYADFFETLEIDSNTIKGISTNYQNKHSDEHEQSDSSTSDKDNVIDLTEDWKKYAFKQKQ